VIVVNLPLVQKRSRCRHFCILQSSLVLLSGRPDFVVAGGTARAQDLNLAFDGVPAGRLWLDRR